MTSTICPEPTAVDRKAPKEAVYATTVQTRPESLEFFIDGARHRGFVSFDWMPGECHHLAVASVQTDARHTTRYRFAAWSDSEAPDHTLVGRRHDQEIVGVFDSEYKLDVDCTPELARRLVLTPPTEDGFFPAGSVVQIELRSALPGEIVDEPEGWFTTVGVDQPRSITVDVANRK